MIKIHKASFDQAEIIADFQICMAKETENIILNQETVCQGVKAVFLDESKGTYYVALRNNEVIASMLITKEWSDWRNSWVLWLQSVFVVPEMRKNGVFRKMFNYLYENIIENSEVSGIRLYVDSSNANAIKVYNSINMNGDHYKVFELMK